MKKLTMRRECFLIQILALVLMCGCATVDTVDEADSDSLRQEGVPKGKVTKHIWDSSSIYPGTTRNYYVYVPAQYDKAKPACVMVFQDGAEYVKQEGPVRVATVFDNLISKGEMPVTIGIFINPGRKGSVEISDDTRVPSLIGKTFTTEECTWVFGEDGRLRLSGGKTLAGRYEQDGPNVIIQIDGKDFKAIYDGEKLHLDDAQDQRGIEYTSLGDRYARFLLEEILPQVGKDYNLVDDAQGRAICGASNGGICAFTVAWERPDAFSKVVSHIGSFTDIQGGHIYPTLIRKSRSNPKPIRIFLQTGEHDLNIEVGDWTLGNLQMESALKYARYDHRFVMGDGGHDLQHGGAIFPETLRWIWRDYPGVKGADELIKEAAKVRSVPSIAGKTITIGQGEDAYTFVFGEDGKLKLRISGGEAGDGIDGEYKQDGLDVRMTLGEDERLEGTYDGKTFNVPMLSGTPGGGVEYERPDDSLVQDGVLQGKVTKHVLEDSNIYPGTTHDYWVYVPAQYDKEKPACVMFFQDGHAYIEEEGPVYIPTVFDNLIHKGQMPVTIAILINPGEKPGVQHDNRRLLEYTTLDDTYARFLLEEMLVEVGKDYNLVDDASGRGICGSSAGGICSFTVAWERPDAISKVISFIGGYVGVPGGGDYPSLIRRTRGNPKPIRAFLQDTETDLNVRLGNFTSGNLQMESALKFAGYDYRFEMGSGGHDLEHAGSILPDMLRWLWRDYPGVKGADEIDLAVKARKKGAAVKIKSDAYLKKVWAKLQAEVEAGNMSAEDAEAKMVAIKKGAVGSSLALRPQAVVGERDVVTNVDETWAVEPPQAHGMDSALLEQAAAQISKVVKRQALVIVRDGIIIGEWYYSGDKDTLNVAYSVSKSFGATLVGIAVTQGLLDVDDLVSDYIPTSESGLHADVTVKHLLGMTSSPAPGTVFKYDSDVVDRLSEIVSAVSGMRTDEFYNKYLKEPLGLTMKWKPREDGNLPFGGNVLSTCRDLARLGWLYLNKGNWKGKQIVSEQFIAEATSPSFPDANSAYGYFWWLNTDDPGREWHRPVFNGTGKMVKSAPANMYMATGYYGQLIYVIPDLNMVVATMGRTEDFETLRTIRKIWAALEPTLPNK